MYIRVISELKRWVRVVGKETKLPSDCFFDIKTQKNALSLLKIDSQEDWDSLNKYIVIPTLGKASLSKITYVLLDDSELKNLGLDIQQDSPGCPYIDESKTSFISHHFDIVDITHEEYLKIAELIINKIESNQQKVLSAKDVKLAAKDLCKSGIIIMDNLKDTMKESINKAV